MENGRLKPKLYMTGSLAKSMVEEVCNKGGVIWCRKLSAVEMKKLADEYVIYGYFTENDISIVKKLNKLGIEFTRITDKIVLDPSLGDTLYVFNAKNFNPFINPDIPDHITIEFYEYRTAQAA